jgi:hypothetical protein
MYYRGMCVIAPINSGPAIMIKLEYGMVAQQEGTQQEGSLAIGPPDLQYTSDVPLFASLLFS